MSDKALTFSDDFPAPDAGEWRRLAEAALKGRALEDALTSQSDERIRIRALCTAADAIEPVAGGGGRSGPWDIRQAALHPDPAEANKEILADLAGGATSVALSLNSGSSGGSISPHGVLIPDLAALDEALKDVLLDVAGISLAGPSTFATAAALAALWEQREIADEKARGWFNVDPLGSLAITGTLRGGLDTALDQLADLAKESAGRWPNVRSIAVTTHAYHYAGCGEAQELAVALATGVAYLRALEARGLDPEAAAAEILFRVSADADIFLTITKLRALRSLWARVLEACGVSAEMQIEAITAPRMFAKIDAPVNILRGTAACMAAAVGGADAITILPHSFTVGLADRPARRIARNLQVILGEESGLGHVADPAAGAWAIEALTGDLSRSAWKIFQQIENCQSGEGGMAAALASGWIQNEIATVRDRRTEAIAAKDKLLTGVNSFVDSDAPTPPVLTPDLSALEAAPATQDLSGLSFADAIQAMGEGASLADFALQGDADSVTPLDAHRLSEPFEVAGEGKTP